MTIDIPDTKLHVYGALICKSVNRLVEHKINEFKRHNLFTATPIEKIGILTGYDTIITDEDCGGYCDSKNMVIALKEQTSYKTIFHEIAHAIQNEVGVFIKMDNALLSHHLKYEWEAESVAFKFCNSLLRSKQNHRDFKAYFSIQDIQFLKNWYKNYPGYADDDINLPTNDY